MQFLYNIAVKSYRAGISLATPFNPKASKWIKGRQGLFENLRKKFPENAARKTAWFHCASLGEFEQGRPVIEAFRKAKPDWQILLTFFSPSGYEIRKNYGSADIICYLPIDTPTNARKFMEITKPSIAVFVKYEFWFNYMEESRKRDIPLVFLSAIFRPSQHFFKWYGGWFRNGLKKASHIFVQDEHSKKLLLKAGVEEVTISGDTRFDRVKNIAEKAEPYPLVEKFKDGKRLILAGSTWPQDEDLLIELIGKSAGDVKFIIAPHETSVDRISELRKKLKGTSFKTLSEANVGSIFGKEVLVIDSIGHLMHLYSYCDIAYIGGGFGAGIHNILEAATFGKPVIFGPRYEKFREAVELERAGGAFPITSGNELDRTAAKLLNEPAFYQGSSKACLDYVAQNTGATEKIIIYILQLT